ncbi:MAG TPA: hypothetical protein PLK89_07360 [Acidobacteriota bacterium]|nr:hypothetical protein [Acidobacteriota bacterium]
MHRWIAGFWITLLATVALPVSPAVADPVTFYFIGMAGLAQEEPDLRLIRLYADFDCDGRTDIAVTGSQTWGGAGGVWDIFLSQPNDQYFRVAQLLFHPKAIAIDKIRPGVGRVSVFQRTGKGLGRLIHYRLSSQGLVKASERNLNLNDQGIGPDQGAYQELFPQPIASEYCLWTEYERNRSCAWRPGY